MSSAPTIIRLLVEGVLESGWDWLTFVPPGGTQTVAIYEGDYTLQRLTVTWSRTPPTGGPQDPDQCTYHFLNLTGGSPDASWTDTDYGQVEAAFDTFWDTIRTHYHAQTKLAEYAWRADGPAFRPHGEELSPTLRLTTRAVAGSGASVIVLPPQCALSVTEVTDSTFTVSGVGVPGNVPGTGRTQLRHRWGRFYLPGTGLPDCVDGRWSATWTGIVADAVQAMYNECVSHDIVPVMYSPTTGNSWSIDEIHVDDIVDVIRSRRYDNPLTRQPRLIDAA
jgi:hypothetical protein